LPYYKKRSKGAFSQRKKKRREQKAWQGWFRPQRRVLGDIKVQRKT
jgi:hypothetical protein